METYDGIKDLLNAWPELDLRTGQGMNTFDVYCDNRRILGVHQQKENDISIYGTTGRPDIDKDIYTAAIDLSMTSLKDRHKTHTPFTYELRVRGFEPDTYIMQSSGGQYVMASLSTLNNGLRIKKSAFTADEIKAMPEDVRNIATDHCEYLSCD